MVGCDIHQKAGIEALLVVAGGDGTSNGLNDVMVGDSLSKNGPLFMTASAASTRPCRRHGTVRLPSTSRRRANVSFSPGPRSESAFRRSGSPFAAESTSNARTMERFLIPTNLKRRRRELSDVDPAPACRWLRHNHWRWRSGQRSSRKSGRTGFPYASADPEAHRCGERRKFRQAQGCIQPTFLLQCKAGTDLWVLGIPSRTRHSASSRR